MEKDKLQTKINVSLSENEDPVDKKLMDLRWIMHTKYAFRLRSLSRFIRDLHFDLNQRVKSLLNCSSNNARVTMAKYS